MKQALSIRSNCWFSIPEKGETFSVEPALELVIIHTDGKNYKLGKNDFIAEPKVNEIRLLVSPDMLASLITELQLHQTKMETIRKNGDQINALIKHIGEIKTEAPTT